jgi:methyl-accepting chemotaxis protein
MDMLNRLSIRTRLVGIAILFLVPIALQVYLFVDQSRKDITFADKEVAGVMYLRSAWPVLSALAGAVSDPALAPSSKLASAPKLEAAAKTHDAEMGSEAASRDLSKALAAVNWPGQTVAAGEKADAAITAARALINKVGDASNLILDPDLDSYYVMDITLLRLPEVIDQARVLMSLSSAYRTQKSLTDDEKAQVLIRAGQFAAAVDGIASSLDSAYKGNGDGKTKPALAAQAGRFAKAAADYLAAINAAAVVLRGDDRAKLDIAGLKRLNDTVLEVSDQFWATSANELERLLVVRIDGFKTKLWSALGVTLAATLLALLFAWSLSRSIIRAIRGLVAGIGELTENMSGAVPHADGRDEIGEVARAIAKFRDHTIGELTAANSAERAEAIRRTQREALSGIAEEVRGSVATIATRLMQSAQIMRSSTSTVTENAGKTRDKITSVVADLNATAGNIKTVAAAVNELASSIGEISGQTAQVTRVTDDATLRSAEAEKKAEGLAANTKQIGEIAGLIASIADQTNLLALNATIEAARAGEAGRGFAVVAQEVKALATQTGKATEEIDRQVTAIREASMQMVTAVHDITKTIADINGITTSIAGAVEQQNAATSEISASLERASRGTEQVTHAVSQMPKTAAETGSVAERLDALAHDLATDADSLQRSVDSLLIKLAA